jgi:hypothetical protein
MTCQSAVLEIDFTITLQLKLPYHKKIQYGH